MKIMGVTYFHAEGEADELCVKLVLKTCMGSLMKIWICLFMVVHGFKIFKFSKWNCYYV